jgi:orotate phosphoribosyltransferase-like protein
MSLAEVREQELLVIELRKKGLKSGQIADRLGLSREMTYNEIWQVNRSGGTVQLTDLAFHCGLDG